MRVRALMPRPKLPARARRVPLNVTLSRDAKKALERMARRAGVSASQLIEVWIWERAPKEDA